jgi:hypothetical protein
VVDRSLDVELRNYRSASLWQALRRELRDPRALDTFVPDRELGSGYTRAIGPTITFVMLTGNVPGLPALAIVRALLVKSAVVAKISRNEPIFAAAFAASLAEMDRRLGEAILVTYWDRSQTDMLAAAVRHADAVIAYGGAEACAEVRKYLGAHQRYIEHGHKVSAGIISRSYLRHVGATQVAERIVRDTCMFNQLACIAPQAYLVEADTREVRSLGAAVAASMAAYADECPPGRLTLDDAMALGLRRAAQAWRAAADEHGDLWHPKGLGWTVAMDSEFPGAGGTGNRFITLIPVGSLAAGVEMLRPLGPHLQNIALGCTDTEFAPVGQALADAGASRICAPGCMAEPSLSWRHDGRMGIAELLRWCDIESFISSGSPRDEGGQSTGETF